jgi:hypothetical protein
MTIDTKGFEIGDEVWVTDFCRLKVIPIKVKIKSFIVEENVIWISVSSNFYHHPEYSILYVYRTKKECQLVCDKLNNKN